jgi:hypothetical protein
MYNNRRRFFGEDDLINPTTSQKVYESSDPDEGLTESAGIKSSVDDDGRTELISMPGQDSSEVTAAKPSEVTTIVPEKNYTWLWICGGLALAVVAVIIIMKVRK